MSLLVVPNTFVNGTGPSNIIDATQMNANFTAVATAVNNIYPSQILPLTAAQATFGATATGVGYKIIANDATAVPFTVSAVTSQSVDILDVTLTSGGVKAFFVDSGGVTHAGGALEFDTGAGGGNATKVYAVNDGASGLFLNVASGSTNGWRFAVNGTPVAQIAVSGSVVSGTNLYSTPAGTTSVPTPVVALAGGDAVAQRGTSSGQQVLGGATENGGMDYNLSVGHSFAFKNTNAAGYSPISGGVYTNASDAALKTNVNPLPSGTAELLALKPVAFTWIASQKPGMGFIAQDVQAVLPDLVLTDNDGIMGVNYDGFAAVLVKAFQEMQTALHAAGIAGF